MHYKNLIYDNYRSSFKGDITEKSLKFGAKKVKPIVEKWTKGLDRRLPAIDLGCGAGELLMALHELGFQNLQGCDISPEQVEITRQFFPQVVHGDLFDYLKKQPGNSIGLIVIFDVIEHLGHQSTFDLMELVHEKLVDSGVFIAHLPNGLSPFVGQVYWGDMTHEWTMTPQSARTLCELHDFRHFEAAEHLGASDSLSGLLRSLAWVGVRKAMKLVNSIETGRSGGDVWTRNFAFKCVK